MDHYKVHIKKRWIGESILINTMYNSEKFFIIFNFAKIKDNIRSLTRNYWVGRYTLQIRYNICNCLKRMWKVLKEIFKLYNLY